MTTHTLDELTEKMKAIGRELRTQNNRMAAHPIFVVQALKRVYGISDGPGDVAVDIWMPMMYSLTEQGAEEHLRLNSHNYTHYRGTRIYVESLYCNPEMIAIREYLMRLGEEIT